MFSTPSKKDREETRRNYAKVDRLISEMEESLKELDDEHSRSQSEQSPGESDNAGCRFLAFPAEHVKNCR